MLYSTPKLFRECSRRTGVVLEDSGYVVASRKLVKLGLLNFALAQLLLYNRLKSVEELLHCLLCLDWDETRQLLGEFRLFKQLWNWDTLHETLALKFNLRWVRIFFSKFSRILLKQLIEVFLLLQQFLLSFLCGIRVSIAQALHKGLELLVLPCC